MFETQRFIIRPYMLNDAKSLFSVMNTENIYRTTYGIPYPCTVHYARNWIKAVMRNAVGNKSLEYAVIRKSDNQYMGNIGLINIDFPNKKCDISYFIRPDCQNNGIATEVSAKMIEIAFTKLQMNRVGGTCMAHNQASARVMEKLKMCYEGLSRNCMIKEDTVVSLKMYSILKEEYFAYCTGNERLK